MQDRKIIRLVLIPRDRNLADILSCARGPSDFTPMRDVIAPVLDRELTAEELAHRAMYPHVHDARLSVQQRRAHVESAEHAA